MAALPAAKKVVYQIEIIRGNFFACLFDLLLDVAEAVSDMVSGDGVQLLLLGGHGIPLLHAFCLFVCETELFCHCILQITLKNCTCSFRRPSFGRLIFYQAKYWHLTIFDLSIQMQPAMGCQYMKSSRRRRYLPLFPRENGLYSTKHVVEQR